MLDEVLRTANDDEDMIFMYNTYLHKMITCFLSHPLARDKVIEERAMSMLSPYHRFVSGIYEFFRKEPELLSGNDDLWTFVNFAGDDLPNFQNLVPFLNMLSTLASN
ncbi:hypothetical protein M0R45_015241 [Rubus argutus]|uniref:Uncharacterized protein n=1 Tax=Rubus argutus TaxID=59490 RepID=A0AAW1XQ72_RUBAR